LKTKLTDDIIGGMGNNLYWAWIYFTSISTSFAFIAVSLVIYVAPESA